MSMFDWLTGTKYYLGEVYINSPSLGPQCIYKLVMAKTEASALAKIKAYAEFRLIQLRQNEQLNDAVLCGAVISSTL